MSAVLLKAAREPASHNVRVGPIPEIPVSPDKLSDATPCVVPPLHEKLPCGRGRKMKLSPIYAVLIAATAALGLFEAARAQNSPVQDPATSSPRREVNITNDSAPGWLPSRIQEEQVLKTTIDYFSALDQQQYERAYAMMAEANRNSLPLSRFIQQNREFQQRSGTLVRRNVLKVTWTKDPASAPFRGVYAAVDIATQFVNVDRHCGYVVLYQRPSGGEFEVMRQESNFIDNATAAKIERDKRAVLDHMWAGLATNCPNYGSTASPLPAR